jgi:hypothetical protein
MTDRWPPVASDSPAPWSGWPPIVRAPVAPPTPFTILSNLILWIDPGPTYCTTISGKINTFTNRGSLGGTITQATAAARAVRNASDASFNALPSFAADGLATFYPLPNLSTLTEGEAFCVMVKAADPSLGNSGTWGRFGTYGQYSFVPYSDGTVLECFGSSSHRSTGAGPTTLASPFLYNVWSAPNDFGIKINGSVFFTRAVNTVSFEAAPTLLQDLGLFMSGAMCMLFVCGSKQTAVARAAFEQWVKTTCGVAIP